MFRLWVVFTVAGMLSFLATNRAAADHPRLHLAVYELRRAHEELLKAGHDFGGHKEKALLAVGASYREVEKSLEAVGEPYNPKYTPPPDLYKGYKNHAPLRHSLVALREAQVYLKSATGNFGGHRKKALEDIDVAIVHVAKCIEFIK